jgi:hypothetical protein
MATSFKGLPLAAITFIIVSVAITYNIRITLAQLARNGESAEGMMWAIMLVTIDTFLFVAPLLFVICSVCFIVVYGIIRVCTRNV